MPESSPEPLGPGAAAARPVTVDRRRQLFVDDALIAATDLQRTFHKPAIHPASPVLVPTTGLERNGGVMPAAAMASVFRDDADGLFRMWYLAGYDDAVAYACSRDGLEWTRPQLGVVPGTNRVLPPLPGYVRNGATVWLDAGSADPAQRHKMLVFYRAGTGTWPRRLPALPPPEHEMAWAYTSADGVDWQQRGRAGPCGDNTSFFHDPFRGKWCFSIRTFAGAQGRKRSLVEHDDFLDGVRWTERDVRPWLECDERDRPEPELQWRPELYKVDCAAYESLMIGLFGLYLGPPNHVAGGTGTPKIIDLHLGFSRDGRTWRRPDRTPFIACSRQENTWNRAYLQASPGICVVQEDSLWFYFSAFSGVSPAQGSGPYAGGSLGLAVLRRDGFASMDGPGVRMPAVDRTGARAKDAAQAPAEGGFLTTVSLHLTGETLFVNARVRASELRVEVLDESGCPIDGFGRDRCRPVTGDATRHAVAWHDAGIARLHGRPVRIRFWLEAGELYSFWTEGGN